MTSTDRADSSTNPFLRFRARLDAYDAVRRGDINDDQFVAIVSDLDAAVAEVDGHGHGFVETPLIDSAALVAAAGLDVDLVIKAELHNVGGSHKARHLMGVAIHLLIAEHVGQAPAERLAIASCGNAALGAAVIAKALGRRLDVFVPTWADRSVLDRLDELGANVEQCERRPGESGDPSYLRFSDAVRDGAVAFSVQATDTPTTLDGGRTLGWELAEQAGDLDAIYVQVGGGALASSVGAALPGVPLFPVQAEGCAPLRRAWDLLAPDFDLDAAAADPNTYMWPWDEPTSAATGILDDITYDWLTLVRATRVSGGEPVVAPEALIVRVNELAKQVTELPVSTTGTAGLAGLMHQPPPRVDGSPRRVAVLFTGIDRS